MQINQEEKPETVNASQLMHTDKFWETVIQSCSSFATQKVK